MKLKAHSPMLNGWQGQGKITTEHSASSYGRPVLLVEGEPEDTFEAILADYEVVKATEWERELLRRAGYRLRGF